MLVLIGMYLMIIIYLCRIKTSEDIADRSMTRLKEIVPWDGFVHDRQQSSGYVGISFLSWMHVLLQAYVQKLKWHNISISLTQCGDSLENAVAERTKGIFKQNGFIK